MTRTLVTVKSAFLGVVSANTATLALLKDGAASVISRKSLRVSSQVAGPLIAYQYGVVTGAMVREARAFYPTLWLIDDGMKEWVRLNQIVVTVSAAYTEASVAGCTTTLISVTEEMIDAALNRPTIGMRFRVKGLF